MKWNDIVENCVKNVEDARTKEVIGRDVATLDCIPAVVQNVIFAAFIFAGIIALILIIYSGIKFILSGGDPKQVEAARKTMTYAIIGFLLILLSFAALNFISTVTGIDCIRFFGFTNC